MHLKHGITQRKREKKVKKMDSQGIEPRTFRMQSEHYTPKPQAHVIVRATESMAHKLYALIGATV